MKVRNNIPVYKISWLRYADGGTIGTYYEPENREELLNLCKHLYKEGKTFDIIGHTSNIYFLPSYSVDILVSTRKVNETIEDEDYIIADCGVSVSSLARQMVKKGIKGFAGKIGMDRNAPEDLLEEPEKALRETEIFLEKYSGNKNTRPILTPRFAPTCTRELISGLGRLGKKYNTGMQTHLVESLWEAEQARLLFPECPCDTGIYERAGLMDNGPVIGGHFIFPSEDDIRIMKEYDCYAAHCPDATVSVIAGIMPAGALLDRGIRIGLGTDLSAGHHTGVYTQVARSVQLSKLKNFYEPDGNRTISFPEAFWMATKQSGTLFGGTGSLEPGSVFDALVIRDMSDAAVKLSPEQTVERFCYAGTKEDIRARYMNGEEIPG